MCFKFQFSGQWPLTLRAFRPASIVTPLGVPGSLPCCKFQFVVPFGIAKAPSDEGAVMPNGMTGGEKTTTPQAKIKDFRQLP